MYLTDISSTDEYLELIEQKKNQVNSELKEHNKRKLRKDTVDTIALVVKPSFECMSQLNTQEQIQFLKDSKKVIENIFRKYINPNFKFDASVLHFDELSPHLHCFGMPLIIDEKTGIETFNTKKFLSLKNVTALNRNYSIEMKELGWNVKDFKLYEDMTPEEQEERKKNKDKNGRDSLKYKMEEKQKLVQELSNLKNLKNDAIEKLIKDGDIKDLAINKMQDNVKYYKDLSNDLINYNDELESKVNKLLFKNDIFTKILKFVSYFLPNAIQDRVNSWFDVSNMPEVSEEEIEDNIIQYVEEAKKKRKY